MGKRKYDTNPGDSKDKVEEESEASKSRKVETKENLRSETLFDIKHFRKELTLKQGQTVVLNQFLQVCTDPDSKEDYLELYLKSGGNSHEILQQISTDNKKNVTLASPTFQIFQMIIMKVQASMPHLITITEEACRYFLNTFSPTIEIMISENSGPKHKKIILKLLTSMITLNPDLGVEILGQPGVSTKNLQHIVDKPNNKDKENVRTLFVHFITAFLIDGHLPLIKALLEKQGLLSLLIPGLVQDEAEATLMFLNILKQNVIDNAAISKTLKLKTFTHQMLQNLFKLYFWKGPPDVERDDKTEYKAAIISLTDEILTTLFTSSKVGLNFIDKTLGTSDAQKNQNLYKALLMLKRPWDNVNQSKLIINIVKSSPDLHRAVITILEHSFEPDHSPQWENAIAFFSTLVDELNPNTMAAKMNEMSRMQIANFMRFTCLPVPLLKHLKAGIVVNDIPVSNVCSKMLTQMVSYLRKYIQLYQMKDSNVVAILENRLEVFVPKHLPTPESILAVIKQVIDNGITLNKKVDYVLEEKDPVNVLINFIDLLLAYNGVYPALIENIESNFDINGILQYASKIDSSRKNVLKFKLLSLWLTIDPTALSPDKPLYKDFFSIMLEIYLASDTEYISNEAKVMLSKLIKHIEVFQSSPEEVDIILYTLKSTPIEPFNLLVNIIEYTIENHNQFEYNVKQAVADTLPDLDINESDYEALFELLMNENGNTDKRPADKLPSTFILGLLNYIKTNKEHKSVLKVFTTNLTINLLHFYKKPELLFKITEVHKYGAKSYVKDWCYGNTKLPDSYVASNGLISLIENFILDDQVIPLDKIFSMIKPNENKQEADFSIGEALFIVDKHVKFDDQELINATYALTYYFLLLSKHVVLSEAKSSKIGDCIEVIVNIANVHNITNIVNIIIKNVYTRDIFNIFSPQRNKKNESANVLTKFVLKFHAAVEKFYVKCQNIDLFKQFQHKTYQVSKKMLEKIKKKNSGIYCEQLSETVKNIGFDDKEAQDLFEICIEMEPNSFILDNNNPSFVLVVLQYLLEQKAEILSEVSVAKILNVYCRLVQHTDNKINLTDLENALIECLRKSPDNFTKINEDNFKIILKASAARLSASNLACLLLKYNEKFVDVLKNEVTNPDVLKQREIAIPIGNAAVIHTKFVKDKALISTFYNEYKQSLMKALEKPHKTGQLVTINSDFFAFLITECMNLKEIQMFLNKTHKFESTHLFHVKLLTALALKFIALDKKCDKIENLLLTVLNLMNNVLKLDDIDKNIDEMVDRVNVIADVMTYKNIDLKATKICENSIWQNFCKLVIKNGLKMTNKTDECSFGNNLMNLLTKFVTILYNVDHNDITMLFDMLTSHSEFLNVMLSYHSKDTKESLIHFLFTLIKLNNSVMKVQQVPLYLSAYHATQAKSDKELLAMIYYYEKNGLPVNDYKPYLWGDSAANYYAVRKSRASALWNQPTPNQILNLFEKDCVERTVRYFPVQEKLSYLDRDDLNAKELLDKLTDDKISPKNIVDKNTDKGAEIQLMIVKSKYDANIYKLENIDFNTLSHYSTDRNAAEMYDPAFVLPILSSLLAPGSFVSCFRILRMGLLSIPIMALASYCPKMRAAGYHVIYRFYQQLETEIKHKNDKLLLTDFIETLRQSLNTAITSTENNPRLPTIAATYLARSILVITVPFDPLYKPLNNFLIAKQQIDFTIVPDFLNLFHDNDLETSERRQWILNLMRDGTKTYCDVKVIFKTMSVKMVLDFYSCVLADKKAKTSILSLISSIVCVPKAADILITAYSIMSWLSMAIFSLKSDDNSLISIMIELLSNLYESLRVSSFMKTLNDTSGVNFPFDIEGFKVKRDPENQIVVLLSDLVSHLSEVSLKDLVLYMKILSKVSQTNLSFIPKQNLLRLTRFTLNKLGNENNDFVTVEKLLESSIKSSCREKLLDISLYNIAFLGDESQDKSLVLTLLWDIVKSYLGHVHQVVRKGENHSKSLLKSKTV